MAEKRSHTQQSWQSRAAAGTDLTPGMWVQVRPTRAFWALVTGGSWAAKMHSCTARTPCSRSHRAWLCFGYSKADTGL